MKNKWIIAIFLSSLLAFSGCRQTEDSGTVSSGTEEEGTADSAVQNVQTVSEEDMFSDRDMETQYDEENSIRITLSGTSAACDSDAVHISDNVITITEEGTYILSGTLEDGMVIIDGEDTEKFQLVLDNAEITNTKSAAVYIMEADKVVITTASGSENLLANSGEYVQIDDNNIDAAVFSKADLTLNGEGMLTVNTQEGHGIVCKDDLALTSGNYKITAPDHGLSGKDSVRIAGGMYTIVSGKDGIHAENNDDASRGFLYVADGTFDIISEGDGMSAGTYLQVEEGDFTIESGGGSANAAMHSDTWDFAPSEQGQTVGQTAETEDSVSTKGMKAATGLFLYGGTFSIDSADDGLHSNGDVDISGGDFAMATGDDGIHGDSAVRVSGGNLNISQSYEGIEGLSIDITGGNISLIASDDGLNAAGGNDSSGMEGRGGDEFSATEGAYIAISGGILHVNASGDGLDSNGSLTVTGGETYVSGPTNDGNGSLDYAGEAAISGGIFVAAGSSGMAQNFGEDSTQGVMMVTVDSCSAGSTISLTDSSGNELVSWQADKAYNSVIISCPEITQGSAYTLNTDGNTAEITMSSLVYGSGGMNPGGMGSGNIGAGGMNPGDMGGTMNKHGESGANRGGRP